MILIVHLIKFFLTIKMLNFEKEQKVVEPQTEIKIDEKVSESPVKAKPIKKRGKK